MKNAGRIALVITGALTALVASALVLGGGLALYGEVEKDDHGYLTTDAERFSADTRALATENLDVDLGGGDWVIEPGDLGNVRLEAESRDGKPLFVGIARTSDVERYLGGVPHTTVDDVEAGPFETFDADYTRHAGHGRPASPEHAGIWAASNQGSGSQTVDWEIEDGDWSVVVMNADGSLGVDADISAGANVPFLNELGWTALGSGSFALVLGIGLIVLAVRRPRGDDPSAPRADHARGAVAGLGLGETNLTHDAAPGLEGPGAASCVSGAWRYTSPRPGSCRSRTSRSDTSGSGTGTASAGDP